MAWRIRKNIWPNGREYWEVLNPKTGEQLVGKNGGTTKHYNRDMAIAARDEMNGKTKDDIAVIDAT